jgi:hypothetical protein
MSTSRLREVPTKKLKSGLFNFSDDQFHDASFVEKLRKHDKCGWEFASRAAFGCSVFQEVLPEINFSHRTLRHEPK